YDCGQWLFVNRFYQLLGERLSSEEERSIFFLKSKQATVWAGRDGFLIKYGPCFDEYICWNHVCGLNSGIAIFCHHHSGHAVQQIIPDGPATEALLNPVPHIFHILDLHPTCSLSSSQLTGSPHALIMIVRETIG